MLTESIMWSVDYIFGRVYVVSGILRLTFIKKSVLFAGVSKVICVHKVTLMENALVSTARETTQVKKLALSKREFEYLDIF